MVPPERGSQARAKIRAKVEEKLRPLTLPNFLTLIRMAIVPFVVIAIAEGDFLLALWILIIGGLTDSFDGYLARKLDMSSRVGAYLDPLADKMLLTAAYISLTIPHGQAVVIPLWLAILALFRDFLIMFMALLLYVVEGVRSFPPSILGKLTTLMHVVTVAAVLAANIWTLPGWMLATCFSISFGLVLVSGFNYIYRASKLIEAVRAERGGNGLSE
ncbi:MAG: CDP-alcohol phosphatidyltransferase family protein [bacterium]|nr:CDP-alcohol phosphatidyltransferase family protein [bacterium]